MFILTQLADFVQFILNTVVIAAEMATYAGFCLTTTLLNFWTLCFNSTASLGQGLNILLEEFLVFICDSFDWLCETLTMFVETTMDCTLGLFGVPGRFLTSLFSLFSFLKNSMPSVLSQTVVLLVDSVVLIGLCVYNAGTFILRGLIYLNDMPHVALLFLAKLLDMWIEGSTEWANSRFVRGALGLAFIYCLVRIDLRYKFHDKCFELFNEFSVALAHILKRLLKLSFRATRALGRTLTAVAVDTARKIKLKPRLQWESSPSSQLGEKLCIICLDSPRNIVFLDCRHLCLCEACADIVSRGGTCPICRSQIGAIIKVYS